MRGWFHERYRHYLAAKGVTTSTQRKYRKEFPSLVRQFPGENPRITAEYARFRFADPKGFKEGSFRTKSEGKNVRLILGKDAESGEFDVQAVLIKRHPRYWAEKSYMEGFAEATKAAEAQGLTEFKFGDSGSVYKVKEAKEILNNLGEAEGVQYLAAKDLVPADFWVSQEAPATNVSVLPAEYLEDASEVPGVPAEFWVAPDSHIPGYWAQKGFFEVVSDQAHHPIEWYEKDYARLSGERGTSSQDKWQDAGAAMFAEVVTAGSARPLLNPREELKKPEATEAMDILFGDEPKNGYYALMKKSGRRLHVTHDGVEFTEGGKRYSVPLENDGLQPGEYADWKKEIAALRKMPVSAIKRRYDIDIDGKRASNKPWFLAKKDG
jgi:hypothetical protein